ncbi:hypothetical protein EDB84DRAFT_1438786 [Lactarius hengduanensis]|nr:hypothetical protein EDB84DRAFT_1438786 [Lactarius hengduanensis]
MRSNHRCVLVQSDVQEEAMQQTEAGRRSTVRWYETTVYKEEYGTASMPQRSPETDTARRGQDQIYGLAGRSANFGTVTHELYQKRSLDRMVQTLSASASAYANDPYVHKHGVKSSRWGVRQELSEAHSTYGAARWQRENVTTTTGAISRLLRGKRGTLDVIADIRRLRAGQGILPVPPRVDTTNRKHKYFGKRHTSKRPGSNRSTHPNHKLIALLWALLRSAQLKRDRDVEVGAGQVRQEDTPARCETISSQAVKRKVASKKESKWGHGAPTSHTIDIQKEKQEGSPVTEVGCPVGGAKSNSHGVPLGMKRATVWRGGNRIEAEEGWEQVFVKYATTKVFRGGQKIEENMKWNAERARWRHNVDSLKNKKGERT